MRRTLSTTHLQLRCLRQQRGLTLPALARQAGVSKGFLSELERGLAPRPSIDTLTRLAEALSISLPELLGQATPQAPEPLPPGLAELARRITIPAEDLQMLAGLRYHGRQPRNADDWEFVYEAIKRSC